MFEMNPAIERLAKILRGEPGYYQYHPQPLQWSSGEGALLAGDAGHPTQALSPTGRRLITAALDAVRLYEMGEHFQRADLKDQYGDLTRILQMFANKVYQEAYCHSISEGLLISTVQRIWPPPPLSPYLRKTEADVDLLLVPSPTANGRAAGSDPNHSPDVASGDASPELGVLPVRPRPGLELVAAGNSPSEVQLAAATRIRGLVGWLSQQPERAQGATKPSGG